MHLLRHVVAPAVIPAVVVAGCVASITGCSSLDQQLSQQRAAISFADSASDALRLQVRAACGKLPNVAPVPLPSGVPQSQSLDTVIFNVSAASNADKARLQVCLAKYPAVTGLDFTDSTDMGS
ncbi:MAG TPA: hypothetical protein VH478_03630 [Trebonia sp.]|jgi:hypothetical protein|nr:hypothetical protein [Trebonia sp.]